MTFIPLPKDSSSGAVQTIAWEHSRIHAGYGYMHSAKLSVNNATNYDYLLKVPAASYPNLRLVSVATTASPIDVFLYETPTFSADGAAAARMNCNRNSANTSTMTLFSGPTVSVVGTQIDYSLVTGTKQSGGNDGIEGEWVLKASTNYLIRLTNNSGSTATIEVRLFWYEV